MLLTLDETFVGHNSALPILSGTHCHRVACLASEIGHRLGLDSHTIYTLGEAALQHHSMILQWDQNSLPRFGPMPPTLGSPADRQAQQVFELETIEALRIFNGINPPKPGSQATVISEILHLANAFDEIFEWRIFDSMHASESIKEINLLMQSAGLWSQQVNQAFYAVFLCNRERARTKAENVPVSTILKLQNLALASDDDLTVDSLEHIALADPVISADLLHAVNSSEYAVTGSVQSINRAIGYIGTVAARDVMLTSAARGIFASSSLHMVWKHSVQCAKTMRVVAHKAGLDPNKAFILGLLHDIGRVFLDCLDSVTRSKHSRICEIDAPTIWIEMASAGCDHAELGASILAEWNFPESITESIRNHHSPQLSAEKLTALLYLVERIEGADEDLASPSRVADALSRIEISQEQFKQMLTSKAPLNQTFAFAS